DALAAVIEVFRLDHGGAVPQYGPRLTVCRERRAARENEATFQRFDRQPDRGPAAFRGGTAGWAVRARGQVLEPTHGRCSVGERASEGRSGDGAHLERRGAARASARQRDSVRPTGGREGYLGFELPWSETRSIVVVASWASSWAVTARPT